MIIVKFLHLKEFFPERAASSQVFSTHDLSLHVALKRRPSRVRGRELCFCVRSGLWGPSWMGQSSSFTTPLCVALCPGRLGPQTLRSMKTHSPCALFWKPFWAKELFTLSFPSWVPPSSVCESSCPSLNGFEKSFNVLFWKVQCFSVAGSVPPDDQGWTRFLFSGCAGRWAIPPWTRASLDGWSCQSHVQWSLSASGGLRISPCGVGCGWDLLPSQGRPSCMAWGVQVPLLCLAKALSLSPSGFLLGLPRSLPTFGALPSPAEGPEPALCWRMRTWCPCCYCPCCGGVSGGGWGTGLTAGVGEHAWGGAGAAAEPLCPLGSLQELLGYELRVQESVAVKACMDVHVPCSFSYPWDSGYPWYSSGELFIYWFREGDGPHSDPVATNDPNRRQKPETRGRFRLVGAD